MRVARDARPVTLGIYRGALDETSPRLQGIAVSPYRVEGEAGRWLVLEIRSQSFAPAATIVFPDMALKRFGTAAGQRYGGFMARIPMNGPTVVLVHAMTEGGRGPFEVKIYYKAKGE